MSRRFASPLPLLAFAALLGACDSTPTPTAAPSAALAPVAATDHRDASPSLPLTPELVATGLQFPRNFAFGHDGSIFVGEGGTGGTARTAAITCAQVVPPVGPYTNGPTGRISRVTKNGIRTTFASGFPSAENAIGDFLGVADVAFVGDEMYALVAGGGCSHGESEVPAGVARVSRTGSWTIVANLSAWLASHPVANPEPDDFEPDGSLYSMIATGNTLVAVEPNHGDVVRVDPRSGRISRIADLSATFGHIVPTVVAERGGALYLSNLGTFPSVQGTERIIRISRNGGVSQVASGFTSVLGLDFDRSGRLYVLETSSVGNGPAPFTGRVVRLDRRGNRAVIVDGLFFPTGMRFGPDGWLYISNKGFGPPQPGDLLRVKVPGGDDHGDDDMEAGR